MTLGIEDEAMTWTAVKKGKDNCKLLLQYVRGLVNRGYCITDTHFRSKMRKNCKVLQEFGDEPIYQLFVEFFQNRKKRHSPATEALKKHNRLYDAGTLELMEGDSEVSWPRTCFALV